MKSDVSGDTNSCPQMDTDIILSLIPVKLKSRPELLLSHLSNILKWNNNGELVNGGSVIQNSHVADLLRACLYTFKAFDKFRGIDEFCQILSEFCLSIFCPWKRPVDIRREV